MYERALDDRGTNDAVVTTPPHVADQGNRTDRFRSRVRRDGMQSLEVEIPRHGVTWREHWALVGLLTLAFVFLMIGIPLAPTLILLNGVGALPFLLFIVIPGLVILCTPSSMMESSFTQTNVIITEDNYCLIRRGITWKSLFQIMFVPSHFGDLESGQFVEATPKVSQDVRRGGLRAQIVTHYSNRSESRDIELGSISFARGLDDEELRWLVEQINCFLRET